VQGGMNARGAGQRFQRRVSGISGLARPAENSMKFDAPLVAA
jgi:hypothetical protein